ncbi:hypothetical protein BpHYR1_035993 [Brachionus plicatilis]|uniref:Uncharacterized protein n=1 Tax=Brachionus plicatilis TaxID=10195 RepID=A0A3M7QPD8_BRAPC|nr:hypothetical protein BpHYR1_035993 [Brachionus plicatilis]
MNPTRINIELLLPFLPIVGVDLSNSLLESLSSISSNNSSTNSSTSLIRIYFVSKGTPRSAYLATVTTFLFQFRAVFSKIIKTKNFLNLVLATKILRSKN